MNRRHFLVRNASAAAVGAAAFSLAGQSTTNEAAGSSRPFFELVTFRLHFGSQLPHLLGWQQKRILPLFEKHRLHPVGIFTVDVGRHIPAVIRLLTSPSLTDLEAGWERIETDPTWGAALTELEQQGPAFLREDTTLLRATAFSPPLRALVPSAPGHSIFELRIYETPTLKQLTYLHERFAGGEIDLFHKHGIHPVLYADTVAGPNKPNMVYLTPFETYAHREKAWASFRDDPAWHKLRDESVHRGGEIVQNITSMILIPASFSMIR